MALTHAYVGDIFKSEETAEGDLLVYGKATGPDLDLDEQVCDPAWLRKAMPDWAAWGNVREQHSAIAAGVGVETTAQGDDWFVKALIVDRGTQEKIRKGVLKGWSIGIHNARVVKDANAPGGRIVGGDIVELSAVDRPCNPTATMALAKSVDGVMNPVDMAGEVIADLSKAVIVNKTDTVLTKDANMVEDDDGEDGGYDETDDITGAQKVIAAICDLVISEATELKTGRYEEIYDISLLMDAVCTLQRFMCREQEQAAGDDDDDDMGDDGVPAVLHVALDAEPDLTKGEKYSAEEKRAMVARGHAMVNEAGEPSFPIGDEEDLGNAIHAVGRGSGDHDAIRRHVLRAAKRLGKTDMIPDNWAANGSLKKKPKAAKTDKKKHSVPEVAKAMGADEVAEIVAKELAKLRDADQERIKALESELVKIKSLPMPGGPVLVPPQMAAISPGSSKAMQYKALAASSSDPDVRAAYRALAAQDEQ